MLPAMSLVRIGRKLSRSLAALEFAAPVTHVYNPLEYARKAHELYLERYGGLGAKVILLGMNPGPFGMAQTGVPFGDVAMVRDFLGLEAPVGRPAGEHPKRRVQGFACTRSEVSGTRLWGWAKERFVTPDAFFRIFFVVNYCPLSFMEEGGRNRTPDKLPKDERDALFAICDESLRQTVRHLAPDAVVGIGRFAEDRARAALGDAPPRIARMLHPSPASPLANRGWAPRAEEDLMRAGLWTPEEKTP